MKVTLFSNFLNHHLLPFCLAMDKLSNGKFTFVAITPELDKALPKDILSIHRTNNQSELAEIYSAADLFVNPTREEMFGLVNVEANACGTPVVTFRTGGSPECIDSSSGIVVEYDDVDAMERAIRYVCEEKPFSEEACVKRAGCFDKREKFREYIDLYEQLMRDNQETAHTGS